MYFKRVLHNILVYKKELILNIIFSMLYAFFSALAFLSLMPMLEVLFNGSPKINIKPNYENYDLIGIGDFSHGDENIWVYRLKLLKKIKILI